MRRLMSGAGMLLLAGFTGTVSAIEVEWPTVEVVSPQTVESTGGCTNPVASQWSAQFAGLSEAVGLSHPEKVAGASQQDTSTQVDNRPQNNQADLPEYLTGDQ